MNRTWKSVAALLIALTGLILAYSAIGQTTKPEVEKEQSDTPPKLIVIESGAEPRRPLRLSPTVGEVQRERLTMSMTMEQTMNGTSLPAQRIPTVTMDMLTRVDDVRDDGLIEYAFEYTDADVETEPGTPPQMVEMMKRSMQSIAGTHGSVLVDRRGIMQETKTEVPDDAEPTARQQMEGIQSSFRQLSAPLPEGAVGVGARWTVERCMTLYGIRMTQVVTYSIASMEGDELTLNVMVTHTADTQQIENPQTDIRLEDFSGRGKGEIRMSLTKLLPLRARLSLTQDSTTRATYGEQTFVTEQSLNMEWTLAPLARDKDGG
jgi:hypothetical protein